MNQWAFQKERSCCDLITMLICKWLLAFHEGFKIGIFLSDISGAFDRVETELLLRKLRRAGLNERWLEFIASYLAPRQAVVIVNGKRSQTLSIADMVYQGTVLGPCLWNAFFSDVTAAVHSSGFIPALFADDLSACKRYERNIPHSHVIGAVPGERARLGPTEPGLLRSQKRTIRNPPSRIW